MFTKVFLLTFHFVSHFGEMLTSRVFFVGGESSHLCEKRKVIATHTMDLLGTKGPKSSDFKAFLKKLPGLDKRFQHVKMYEDSMFEEGLNQ